MNRVLIGLLAVMLLAGSNLSCTAQNTAMAGIDRYNNGVAFLEEGEYDNAIIEFKAALRADPDNFEAQKNLGGAYLYQDNWLESRDNYLLARDMNPSDPSIYANLALVYQHLGEPELAWDNISKARDIDDRYPLMHYRAGELFLAQGYTEEAMVAFGDAIRLEPDDSRLAETAQTKIDEILAVGTPEIIDEAPPIEEELEIVEEENLEVEETEGEEILEEGEDVLPPEDEGLTEEEAPPIEEDEISEDDELLENGEEGEGDGTEEDPEGTEEEVEEEIIPELPELEGDDLYNDRLSRGRRMRGRGSYAAAIQLLLEAYDVHPEYKQVNYELGLAYFSNGQLLSAKRHLEKYISLETDTVLRVQAEAKLAEVEQAIEDSEGSGGEQSEESEAEETPRFF